jgi:hypothetical protein
MHTGDIRDAVGCSISSILSHQDIESSSWEPVHRLNVGADIFSVTMEKYNRPPYWTCAGWQIPSGEIRLFLGLNRDWSVIESNNIGSQ